MPLQRCTHTAFSALRRAAGALRTGRACSSPPSFDAEDDNAAAAGKEQLKVGLPSFALRSSNLHNQLRNARAWGPFFGRIDSGFAKVGCNATMGPAAKRCSNSPGHNDDVRVAEEGHEEGIVGMQRGYCSAAGLVLSKGEQCRGEGHEGRAGHGIGKLHCTNGDRACEGLKCELVPQSHNIRV